MKQIAFLHAYCGLEPRDIVRRYPSLTSLAKVHLALGQYFSRPKPIDAELRAEIRFNQRGSLDDGSMSLPSVGLASLVQAT